jgi:hypothetical protein
MSRRGNCRDNACSEMLFGPQKVERRHGQSFTAAVLPRMNCVSPMPFEKHRLAALVKQAGP